MSFENTAQQDIYLPLRAYKIQLIQEFKPSDREVCRTVVIWVLVRQINDFL